jgi:hypothetical protein
MLEEGKNAGGWLLNTEIAVCPHLATGTRDGSVFFWWGLAPSSWLPLAWEFMNT